MILSVSRRTDIPALYSEWFYNRIKEGFVLVRNPMSIHQVSRIDLSPEGIDCIVFWSKNPQSMLARIDELKEYEYYFQFTINGYENDFERNIPALSERINTFKELADKIGTERVIWRYDPIILTDRYPVNFHIERFGHIANALKASTKQCIISFVDVYKKLQHNFLDHNIAELNENDICYVSSAMAKICDENGIRLKTCAEKIDLSMLGIEHAHCIDENLISQLIGNALKVTKDKNQREECGCISSIDIGQYNTCTNGCIYCYANFNDALTKKNSLEHDDNSVLLTGSIAKDDRITKREMKSVAIENKQITLFDMP